MGATTDGTAVPVSEAGSHPEATLGLSSRRVSRPRYISWASDMLLSGDGLMAGPAGRRQDRSGEAEMASLGVARSGSVAQVGTLGPEKLLQSYGGSSGATTAEANGGAEDDHTGFDDVTGDSDRESRGPTSLRPKKESRKQKQERRQWERERRSVGYFLKMVPQVRQEVQVRSAGLVEPSLQDEGEAEALGRGGSAGQWPELWLLADSGTGGCTRAGKRSDVVRLRGRPCGARVERRG